MGRSNMKSTGSTETMSSTKSRSGATTRGRNATAASTGSYVMTAGLHGENAVQRTRNPHDHDVLCGRGGGINSHPGNKVFRQWVKERKNEYNLASNKAEKARVSKEIVDKVRALNPPGKFLQRDPGSSGGIGGSSLSGWWVEIDEAKAMAKTSQALREGAPKIRADHAHDVDFPASSPRTSRKRVAPRTTPPDQATPSPRRMVPRTMSPASAVAALKHAAEMAGRQKDEAARRSSRKRAASQMAPPLMSNADVAKAYSPAQAYRQDTETRTTTVDPRMAPTPPPEETETPPLKPIAATIPGWPPVTSFSVPQGGSSNGRLWEVPQRVTNINRANSLALSDVGNVNEGLDEEFVNPFDDESETSSGLVRPAKKEKLVRTLTSNSSSSHGDLGGIGALLNGPKLTHSDVPRQRSSGNLADKKLSDRSVMTKKTRPSPGNKTAKTAKKPPCFCQCGTSLEEGTVCECGALADHLMWRDDAIPPEEWLHISGFYDQIVPVKKAAAAPKRREVSS